MRKVCEYFIASSFGRVFSNEDGSALDVNVEMRRGEASVSRATVNTDAVMAYGPANCGVALVSGTIGVIRGRIPWNAMGREAVVMDVEDVELVARLTSSSDAESVFDDDADDAAVEGGERSKGAAVMAKALDVLCRGLKARVARASMVVQDASGVAKFIVRVDAADYTHGTGATFDGVSIRRVSTGYGCSVTESVVDDARARVRYSKDASSHRLDVEFDAFEAVATVHTMRHLADIASAYGSAATERLRGSTSSRPKRSFIDDVLSHENEKNAMEASAYHDATSDDMGESVYEDSSDAFFDAEDALRELSSSMALEPESPSRRMRVVVSCPECTVSAPFEAVRCTLRATSVEIDISDALEVSWTTLEGAFAVNDADEIAVVVDGSDDRARCRVVVHDDHASLVVGRISAKLNQIEYVNTRGDSSAIEGSIYWLKDSTHPLDGSLPRRCLTYVRDMDASGDTGASLREHLANDASICVKLRIPSADVTLSADVLDIASFMIESMYELPEYHPLALRMPTPDSVLNPIVLALSVDQISVQLDPPSDVNDLYSTALAESVASSDEIQWTFSKVACFASTGISGAVGADFIWAQCVSSQLKVNGTEVLVMDNNGVSNASVGATLALAREFGETTCANASIAGVVVSVGECESIIQRLNTFIPAREEGVDVDSGCIKFMLSLCDASLVYKSNDSFAIIHNDFLRVSLSPAPKDARDVLTTPRSEVLTGEITGYVAPKCVKDTGDIRTLCAFPFTAQCLRAEKFARMFTVSTVTLSTVTSTTRTAITSIQLKSCRSELHKDTIRSAQRLFTSDVEAFDDSTSPQSGDENEYVFVSPVKKPKSTEASSRGAYGVDVTASDIENATQDHVMFPKRSLRTASKPGMLPMHRVPLMKRDSNAPIGPNVIDNFFYRETRRIRKRKPAPLFASGSVTAVRQRSLRHIVSRAGDAQMSTAPHTRFAGEFPSIVPIPAPVSSSSPEAIQAGGDVRTRYLPLPQDVSVPLNTMHIDVESLDVRVLSGLFWAETPATATGHADSVATDALGTSTGIEFSATKTTTRIDAFSADGGVAAHRLACSVKNITCVDITAGATWPIVMQYDAVFGERTPQSDSLTFDVTAVRPDADAATDVEYVVKASMLPVHIKLDQRVLRLLLGVFREPTGMPQVDVTPPDNDVAPDVAYFQKIEVDKLSLRFDYCGRHVDIDALRSGNLLEALNLIPWDGVRLDIKPVRVSGVLGVGVAVERVARSWLEDVSRTQAHKFLASVKPIKSAANIGRNALKVVSKPLEYRRRRGGVVGGLAIGVGSLIKAVSLEAMELGAFAAGQSAALLAAAECMMHTDDGNVNDADEEPETLMVTRSGTEPATVLEGLSLASKDVWRGAQRAAKAVIIDPYREYATGSTSKSTAALRAIKATPFATITGAKGVTKAIDHALTGAKNSLRESPERATTSAPSPSS